MQMDVDQASKGVPEGEAPLCHQERFSQNGDGWTVVKVCVICMQHAYIFEASYLLIYIS